MSLVNWAPRHAEGIYHILKQVLRLAKLENLATGAASNRLAERRIEAMARLKRMHLSSEPPRFRSARCNGAR